MPLAGVETIYRLTKSTDVDIQKRGKDSYYRMLANQKINWRSFLAQFVKQYLLKNEHFTAPENGTKCLIFDDTDITKTGITIEGVSKNYNHVSKRFYLGFKLLVTGYRKVSLFQLT